MALGNLIIGKPFLTRIQTATEELVLDAMVSESHPLENSVTEYPIEAGANIVDHIQNRPREITVEGFITNAPIRYLAGLGDNARGVVGSSDEVTGKALNYAEVAFAFLQALHASRSLVNVVTKFKTYENMALVSGTIPRDRNTGDALRFSLILREVRKVSLKTTLAPVKKTTSGAAQPLKETGKQTAQSAPADVQEKSGSILFNLFN